MLSSFAVDAVEIVVTVVAHLRRIAYTLEPVRKRHVRTDVLPFSYREHVAMVESVLVAYSVRVVRTDTARRDSLYSIEEAIYHCGEQNDRD